MIKNDTSLLLLSDSILKLIKNKEYTRLTKFINVQNGILFSPYGIADTLKNQRLSPQSLVRLINNKKQIKWGSFEGTGEPIDLNINDYFKRFVYDVDFINAEEKSINKIIGPDSSSSNITTIFPNCIFVQFYFSGFKKKYEGMDWKSLVLVFKNENTKPSLLAIIHDEWKI